MNLAVIPARGGSKRIPSKNIKLFAGQPLISYSINAALASGLFEKVIVSTDSEDIAAIAREHGAETPFIRPPELSDDHTGTTPVTRHAIGYCQQHFFEPEFTCCIYATAPFLQPEFLSQGLESLKQDMDYTFAFSVTSYGFPIQRSIRLAEHGVEPMFKGMMGKRSQDLEEAYHDAGQFYWGRTSAWLKGGGMFTSRSQPVVLPRHLVQDIDTPEDWERAELMYKAYVQSK